MDLKATLANSYRNRLILIAAVTLLYSAWCLYDAMVAYPDKIEARERFEEVQAEHPETWKTTEWPRVAEQNGWDGTKEPDKMGAWNIATQWIQFGIVFPIGVYCLYSLTMWQRRYIGADDTKLYTHTGEEIPFDSITRIDAVRWETKGIAVIQYDTGQGIQSLILDDWKYTREPSDQIFDRLRENLDADQITGLTQPQAAQDAADAADDAAADQAPADEAAGDQPPVDEADRPRDTTSA